MNDPHPTARFTGRHMAIIMICFFGVVIAVNLMMARFAVGTFGGTVVDNSYVASQKFNGWLEEARAQDALGWNAELTLDPARYAIVTMRDDAGALEGATLSATARHPVGRADNIALSFRAVEPGSYRSNEALPAGRWQIHVTASRGEAVLKQIGDVR